MTQTRTAAEPLLAEYGQAGQGLVIFPALAALERHEAIDIHLRECGAHSGNRLQRGPALIERGSAVASRQGIPAIRQIEPGHVGGLRRIHHLRHALQQRLGGARIIPA